MYGASEVWPCKALPAPGFRNFLQRYREYSITRTHITRTYTVNCELVLHYLRTAHHTRFGVLNFGSTSLIPPENGANLRVRKSVKISQENWFPEWCKLKHFVIQKIFMKFF